MQLHPAQRTEYCPRIRCNLFLKTLLHTLVGNSQATAGVDVANVVSLLTQGSNQISHALKRRPERTNIGNLRPNVASHTIHCQIWLLRGRRAEAPGSGKPHAELSVMVPG